MMQGGGGMMQQPGGNFNGGGMGVFQQQQHPGRGGGRGRGRGGGRGGSSRGGRSGGGMYLAHDKTHKSDSWQAYKHYPLFCFGSHDPEKAPPPAGFQELSFEELRDTYYRVESDNPAMLKQYTDKMQKQVRAANKKRQEILRSGGGGRGGNGGAGIYPGGGVSSGMMMQGGGMMQSGMMQSGMMQSGMMMKNSGMMQNGGMMKQGRGGRGNQLDSAAGAAALQDMFSVTTPAASVTKKAPQGQEGLMGGLGKGPAVSTPAPSSAAVAGRSPMTQNASASGPSPNDLAAFQADAFVAGAIPTIAPPPEVC